jgi:hypothetical protein
LEHRPARRGGGVDRLLVQIQVAIERLQFVQKADQVLQTQRAKNKAPAW